MYTDRASETSTGDITPSDLGDSDGEDTEPETSQVDYCPPKKRRLTAPASPPNSPASSVSTITFFNTWHAQPRDEDELREYERQASLLQKKRESRKRGEEETLADNSSQEQEPQPDPTQWGERLGLISSGTPNQPPIVLHCFEDLRPSDEDEGEYIGEKRQ
nr:up1 [Human bocavirus 1]BDB39273.1 up1 [Human bocavirus 1]BDB39280.1 up1 [Human bocavirus 1]BDB39287.1 up1 [Human bocavirus 1]BDB39294.1 up1 [Human bocavirus 1]